MYFYFVGSNPTLSRSMIFAFIYVKRNWNNRNWFITCVDSKNKLIFKFSGGLLGFKGKRVRDSTIYENLIFDSIVKSIKKNENFYYYLCFNDKRTFRKFKKFLWFFKENDISIVGIICQNFKKHSK